MKMSSTAHAFNRNVPYLKQQFSALLRNTSPVITLICLITTCGYLLSFSETAVRVLSVTPGYILPTSKFWIWTAFTFCFIELHWWEVLVDVTTVGLCGKMLEPLWGQMEMFKFFALTNIGVSILTTIYYLFYYMCTKNTYILFDVHIHGLAGYVAGICVAVRQIMPDHLIFKTRYGKLTNRNVPLTVLLASIVGWSLHLLDGTYPAMFASGLLVAWIYLRFYQHHPNRRGDSSESFTFASFFPNFMQPLISVLVNPLYVCCLRLGVVKAPALMSLQQRTSSMSSSLTTVSIATTSGVDAHDIERRKQIALKALSERLKVTDSTRHNQLPKSFPNVSVAAAAATHLHKHHHNHQQQQQHHHHHHHQHHQQQQHHHHHHHHQHGTQHLHVAHSSGSISRTALDLPFLAQARPTTAAAPITTARAEPRMISTMSPIAIPMPAPAPKIMSTEAAADAIAVTAADADTSALVLNMEPTDVA